MLQFYRKQFMTCAVLVKKENRPIKEVTETHLFKDFSVLVDQNFKTLHTVTSYSASLGFSPKSVTKHFQKLGAIKPSTFIKNRILLEAKRLLIYTDKSLKEIAFELGFNDPAYLPVCLQK